MQFFRQFRQIAWALFRGFAKGVSRTVSSPFCFSNGKKQKKTEKNGSKTGKMERHRKKGKKTEETEKSEKIRKRPLFAKSRLFQAILGHFRQSGGGGGQNPKKKQC